MARVVFVQTEWFEHLGVLYLASAVKAAGHEAHLIFGRDPEMAVPRIVELAPDVVAFTATTGAHNASLRTASALRPYFNGKIIMGGPHPTFFPEVVNEPCLDAVFRGEGEAGFPEMLSMLDRDEDWTSAPGVTAKIDDIEEDGAELVSDLDAIPFPDRGLLAEADPSWARVGMRRVMAGRGCPYGCTYCFNKALQELSRGKGPYVRIRSVENVMAELKTLKEQGATTINFVDDSFGMKESWTLDLLDRYGHDIGLPFIVNLRPEQATPDTVDALKGAGCYCVQLGIESAVPRLRKEVLGRDLSNEIIEDAARRIKSAKIRLLTYNMVGLPGESLDEAAETLDLNGRLDVDYPRVSIFQPYPRTVLGDRVLGKEVINCGVEDGVVSESYFRRSPLKGEDARRIENLQKFFAPYINIPRLRPFIRAITRVPANPFFDLVFLISIGIQYKGATNRSWKEMAVLGAKNLSAYFT